MCVGLLVVGLGQADVGRADLGEPIADRAASGTELGQPNMALPSGDSDVTELIDRALAARVVNGVDFAALVRAAGTACPDRGAARRLGDVAAMAARWSSAVQDGRPKAQAVAEAQLDTVDWDALVAACVGAS
jgi:hypothetical protein